MSARLVRRLLPLLLFASLAALPLAGFSLPLLFAGALNGPGTLNLLSLCFVFGALALSYDLLFGYTGLLSFGHALYFATGAYTAAIVLERLHAGVPAALGAACVAGFVVPLLLGAVALRTRDVSFAMVTLAFAEAGSILVLKNPFGLTGGEEGLVLGAGSLPPALTGVANSRNVYWIALALLAVACGAGWWAVHSRAGHIWQAIRENERRVAILGIDPYAYKLSAFVLAGFLAAIAGAVYLLVQGNANPQIASANFTLALLVMVVLGGVGTLWGAVLGGIAYEYLDFRFVELSNSAAVQQLPSVFRTPLSEPLFLLGTLFVVLVVFVPGGLAGALRRFARTGHLAKFSRSVLH